MGIPVLSCCLLTWDKGQEDYNRSHQACVMSSEDMLMLAPPSYSFGMISLSLQFKNYLLAVIGRQALVDGIYIHRSLRCTEYQPCTRTVQCRGYRSIKNSVYCK